MHQIVFAYAGQGRSPLTIIMLLFGTGFLWFGLTGGAPWYWFAGPLIFVAGAGWLALRNPKSGSRMTSTHLHLWSGSWQHNLPLDEVKSFRILVWSDGPPSISAMMKDGQETSIPFNCIGRREVFVAALDSLGIAVENV